MSEIDLRKLSILVVDDESFVRSIVIRMLRDLGYMDIHQAKDGSKAVKLLLNARPPINLVILDLKMPKIDGLELLTFIRSAEEINNRNIPVIVLTGHADTKNIRTAAGLGIHGFLAKPISKFILDKQIRKAISMPPIDLDRLNHE